jgi:hypothetical protein
MNAVVRPALFAADFRRLGMRLESMGYPVAHAEASRGTPALFVDRGAGRAAILPAGLADLSGSVLEDTAKALAGLAPSRKLTLLAWGPAPGPSARQRLREAGVELALFEPIDTAVLRFQVNRALTPPSAARRRALRAPIEAPVELRFRLRTRSARVYSMSASGAYILEDEPLRAGRKLTLEVPVGRLHPRTRARVVLANPAADRAHPDLPPGMAVAFEEIDHAYAAVIQRLVEERLAALAV